jgi:hypothetical protein
MDVKQVADIVNGMTVELLGEGAVQTEDLSNVVDMGKAIFDNISYDKFVKSLIDHIGRVMFVNRTYTGSSLALRRDSWEYGAVMEKITETELPEAVETEDWELTDGASYDPNVFNKPKVAAKFYNKRTTFEVDRSIADRQARSAFSSPEQLNAFVSMLFNGIDKSINLKTEALSERVINNMIAQTLAAEFPNVANNNYSGMTGVKAVNLLYTYNQKFSKSLTAALCLYDEDFLKWAAMIIRRYVVRMSKMSTLFNIGGLPRFTPSDLQHVILHGDFSTAADMYLQADTFHNELVSMPEFIEVPYFQGSGTDYDFTSTSKISATIELPAGTTKTITTSGIIGVIFDHDACGICCDERRVDTNYNPKANFTNYFYKQFANYYGDANENFVVFYVA